MTKKGKMAGPKKSDEKKEEGEKKSSENLMVRRPLLFFTQAVGFYRSFQNTLQVL